MGGRKVDERMAVQRPSWWAVKGQVFMDETAQQVATHGGAESHP